MQFVTSLEVSGYKFVVNLQRSFSTSVAFNYRPQTMLRKGNLFTKVCQEFCPQGGGGGVHPLGRHPLARHPLGIHPLGRPPGRHPPGRRPSGRHPSGRYPPGRHPYRGKCTSPRQTDTPWQTTPPGRHLPRQTPTPTPLRDGHCRGRYASYWNAFLLIMCPQQYRTKFSLVTPQSDKE